MALTEEQKKQLYKFIVEERHYAMNDIYVFMPDVDHRYLREVLKNITSFIRFDRCPYCNTSILVTYSNRQQIYCCPEHKKAFNNRNRPKTRVVVFEGVRRVFHCIKTLCIGHKLIIGLIQVNPFFLLKKV